ncbi:hypothetical protein CLAFUW4_14838 [Fulvia fulva]|nr:hypothetical protein CLAFUR0_14831 [Fulvia fulva]WPV23026.1 hypothetical protein CLAFUW4_14838 [Fulvia fulva]WPV37969.1 hypothetical protein CLAFUW7_14839 [Fulvia fulva]
MAPNAKYDYSIIARFYCEHKNDPAQPLAQPDWLGLSSLQPATLLDKTNLERVVKKHIDPQNLPLAFERQPDQSWTWRSDALSTLIEYLTNLRLDQAQFERGKFSPSTILLCWTEKSKIDDESKVSHDLDKLQSGESQSGSQVEEAGPAGVDDSADEPANELRDALAKFATAREELEHIEQDTIRPLRKQIAQHKRKDVEREEEKARLVKERDAANQRVKDLEEATEQVELRESLRVERDQTQRLGRERDISQAEISMHQESLRVEQGESQRLRRELDTSQAELSMHQESLRVEQGESQRLRRDLDVSQAELSMHQESLRTERETLANQAEETKRLRRELDTSQAELLMHQESLRAANLNQSSSGNRASKLQHDLSTAKQEAANLRQQLRDAETQASDYHEKLQAATTLRQRVQGENVNLRRDLQTANTEVKSLTTQLTSARERISTLEHGVRAANVRCDGLTAQVANAEDAARAADKRCDGLTSQLAEAIRAAGEQYDSRTVQLTDAEDAARAADERCDGLTSQLEEAEITARITDDRCTDLTSQLMSGKGNAPEVQKSLPEHDLLTVNKALSRHITTITQERELLGVELALCEAESLATSISIPGTTGTRISATTVAELEVLIDRLVQGARLYCGESNDIVEDGMEMVGNVMRRHARGHFRRAAATDHDVQSDDGRVARFWFVLGDLCMLAAFACEERDAAGSV